MTGPVSPLAQALRLLQVQLAQARAGAAAPGQQARGRSMQQKAEARAVPTALQALRTQLREARRADGSLSPSKALRLFVQAVLLDELGASLQLDPAMASLVERACQALERDADSAALLADALRELEALSD